MFNFMSDEGKTLRVILLEGDAPSTTRGLATRQLSAVTLLPYWLICCNERHKRTEPSLFH